MDTTRKVCGHCHGRLSSFLIIFIVFKPSAPRFELVVNGKQVSVKAQGSANSATPKAPNPFAAFVKENYKNHKAPGVKHGDVMRILSAKFSETKISK